MGPEEYFIQAKKNLRTVSGAPESRLLQYVDAYQI